MKLNIGGRDFLKKAIRPFGIELRRPGKKKIEQSEIEHRADALKALVKECRLVVLKDLKGDPPKSWERVAPHFTSEFWHQDDSGQIPVVGLVSRVGERQPTQFAEAGKISFALQKVSRRVLEEIDGIRRSTKLSSTHLHLLEMIRGQFERAADPENNRQYLFSDLPSVISFIALHLGKSQVNPRDDASTSALWNFNKDLSKEVEAVVYSHQWRKNPEGSAVLWDNSALVHQRIPSRYATQEEDLLRINL